MLRFRAYANSFLIAQRAISRSSALCQKPYEPYEPSTASKQTSEPPASDKLFQDAPHSRESPLSAEAKEQHWEPPPIGGIEGLGKRTEMEDLERKNRENLVASAQPDMMSSRQEKDLPIDKPPLDASNDEQVRETVNKTNTPFDRAMGQTMAEIKGKVKPKAEELYQDAKEMKDDLKNAAKAKANEYGDVYEKKKEDIKEKGSETIEKIKEMPHLIKEKVKDFTGIGKQH